jgi:hypothetical protein
MTDPQESNSNHSILWSDATLERDKALVRYLVEHIVADGLTGHHERCVDKIMSEVQTEQWQAAFPQRTYIFSVYYALSIGSVAEITLSLHAQALELLYFNIASTKASLTLNTSASFDHKLRVVFKETYKWSMPQTTADAIRILRNDVMHTGTIAGVLEAYRNPDNPAELERFFANNSFDSNQLHTNVQNRMHLAHMFNRLVQDMAIRTLGLNQDDMAFDGAPAWRPDIFGYDHENRPEWLRA